MMHLHPCLCLFVLLALDCLSRCSGRPAAWPFRELEEREEEEDQRSKRLENEIWLLKRILENDQIKRERELSQQELDKRQQRNEIHPRAFLERFGYLPSLPRNVSHEPVSMKKAIMHMQHMYHIKETGDMNEKTIEMMQVPRCGMPDATPKEYTDLMRTNANSISDIDAKLIAENFYVPGYKWKKTELTWRLKNYSNRLSPEVTKAAMHQAFKYWSDVSGLSFTETEFSADINLEFVGGQHQDGPQNAFDGSGGVLAHAFYPESGETHFDLQEIWTDGQNEGINLKIVATHELGHALGIGHSEVKGALMAPYYQGYEPSFNIRQDDIRAIQSLYGGPKPPHRPTFEAPTQTTKNPTPPSGGPPNTCDLVYKAITQTHDYRIYVYNGRWMWRTSEYGLDQGFPTAISTYYEEPPEGISAAIFSWKTYHTYFFKGKKIWKYYGFQRVTVKSIETQGYPENPKAAIASKDGIIYLLKDGKAWTFDEKTLDVKSEETPISMQDLFPGAPTNFDSVVRLVNDQHLYFFVGQNYLKYSEDADRVLDGYPKPKAGPWMGPACGAKPYTPK